MRNIIKKLKLEAQEAHMDFERYAALYLNDLYMALDDEMNYGPYKEWAFKKHLNDLAIREFVK